jgi:hypothetical protein
MTHPKRLAHMTEQEDIDEQERRRRYYERLSDWSEPGAVKVYRKGKLVGLPSVPNGSLNPHAILG